MSPARIPVGLCGECRHALRRPTRRGTVYLRCALAAEDPRFPRYPSLPVLSCAGHDPSLAAVADRTVDAITGAGVAVSVWCGVPGSVPAYSRDADRPHYAASLMKLPVLLALYGTPGVDPDDTVRLTPRFDSSAHGTFEISPDEDNDAEPWARLGEHVPLRWLAERMIVASSNLAADAVLAHLGVPAVQAVCPPGVVITRPIGDIEARASGLTNSVTAAGAAALVTAVLAAGPSVRQPLLDQRHRDGIPSGMPNGTVVGSKGGWVDAVRHDAAFVTDPDRGTYVLVVCTSGLGDGPALAVIRELAAAAWAGRSELLEGRG